MQLVGAVLLACLAGLAQAKEKQIIVGATPPPPASVATVPGLGFSVDVPGYTTSTWTQAFSTKLCDAMVAATSGYDKAYIKCTVQSVTAQGTAGVTAVEVGGYMYWAACPSCSINNAEISRNAVVSTLQNPVAADAFLNALFPGARFDYTCDPTWAPLSSTDVSDWLPVLGFPGARCKVARMGFTGAPFNDAETAGFPSTTVGAVGIDNGKACPGNVIPTTGSTDRSIDAGTLQWVNPAITNMIGCHFGDTGDSACWVDLYPGTDAYDNNNWDNLVPQQTIQFFVSEGTGIPPVEYARLDFESDDVNYFPFTDRPSQACYDQLNAFIFGQEHTVENLTGTFFGPGVRIVFADGMAFGTGDLSSCTENHSDYFTFNGGDLTIAGGDWSPSCDTDSGFYTTNSAPSTTTNLSPIGYACPTCFAQNNRDRTVFNYNGPDAGLFCTEQNNYVAPDGINGVKETAVAAAVSVLSGASCVSIGVSKETNGNAGKPMIPKDEATLDNGRIIAVSAIFPPTTRTANAGAFSQNAVRAYAGATNFADVALDTQWSVPCSTPLISQPTSNTVTPLLAKVDAGSCNTKSYFNNGFSSGSSADSHAYALLSSPVVAPVVNPSPTPAPAPAPSNGTSPTPAPTPAPSPAPSTTCTYSGRYQIQSVACAGKYLAFSLSSSDNLVYLRTTSQSSPPRTYWNLDATAVVGETPAGKAIFAEKADGAKQLAHPDAGPKLGGSSWKYKIVPDTTTADCMVVRLAGNGRPSASKYLGVNDSCTGFTWSAQSTNPGQTFKLNKA